MHRLARSSTGPHRIRAHVGSGIVSSSTAVRIGTFVTLGTLGMGLYYVVRGWVVTGAVLGVASIPLGITTAIVLGGVMD